MQENHRLFGWLSAILALSGVVFVGLMAATSAPKQSNPALETRLEAIAGARR